MDCRLNLAVPLNKQNPSEVLNVFVLVSHPSCYSDALVYLNFEGEFYLSLEFVYPQARQRVPFLRRFAGDWALQDIVRLHLKNVREHRLANGLVDGDVDFVMTH